MSTSFYTAIFFPTPSESSGFKKICEGTFSKPPLMIHRYPARIFCGESESKKLLLIETGIGLQAAAQAAAYVFENYSLASAWLVGVAGGASAGMQTGEVVLGKEMSRSTDPDRRYFSDLALLEKSQAILEKTHQKSSAGLLLSLDKIAFTESEKRNWALQTQALGFEMEGAAIAAKAEECHVPFVHLRWILDPLEYALPDVSSLVDERGEVMLSKLMPSLIKNPGLFFQFPGLIKRVRLALKPMNEFLKCWWEGE